MEDDTAYILFSPDDGFNSSIDTLIEAVDLCVPLAELNELAKDAPPISAWKTPSSDQSLYVTVDRAREQVGNQAQHEIDHIRERANSIIGVQDGGGHPGLRELANYLFGKGSRLFQCLRAEVPLFKDGDEQELHQMFCRCLGTFYYCCTYDQSLTDMNSEGSIISTETLATVDEYKLFWESLSNFDHNRNKGRKSNRVPKPLWRSIEDALNKVLHELFVEGFEGKMEVTIDDDKVHFLAVRPMEAYEPKATQHVRDNARGFVIDTAAYTASGVPVAVHCQGHNDSTRTSTDALLRQFVPADGGADAKSLTNMSFGFDRGFLNYSRVRDIIVKGGGIFAGTLQRQDWVPFTYSQRLRSGDDRTDIEVDGPKAVFCKQYKLPAPSHVSMFVYAYRNGTGGVTLALSTEHAGNHWEFVLKNPRDRVWYSEAVPQDLKRKWFRLITRQYAQGGPSEQYQEDCIAELTERVQPMTTEDKHAGWLMARALRISSYTADRFLSILFHTNRTVLASVGFDIAALETVFRYVRRFRDSELFDHSPEVLSIQHNVWLMQENPETHIQHLAHQLEQNELSPASMKTYIQELGGKPASKVADLKAQLESWIHASPSQRPYVLRDVKDLIAEAKQRMNYKAGKKVERDTVIAALIREDEQSGRFSKEDSLRLSLLERLLQSTYLPKLSGRGKEYCKRGHELEPVLAAKLQRDSDEGTTPYKLLSIFSPGNVRHRDRRYVSDTIDFLSVAKERDDETPVEENADSGSNTELTVIGLEMKSREASQTEQQERLSSQSSQSQQSSTAETKYDCVDCDDENLCRFIVNTHEATQVLHHAYTFDLDIIGLIVGDDNGDIIRGIFIQFEKTLKEAYEKTLGTLYDLVLKWAYEGPIPVDGSNEAIADLLTRALENRKIPRESFDQLLEMSRFLDTKMTLPLPPIARIVPFVCATWNALKGGSDTITKLLDSIGFRIPKPQQTPCGIVTGRYFLIFGIAGFRENQIMTSKNSIKEHYGGLLLKFRDAASHRRTFPQAIREFGRILCSDMGRHAAVSQESSATLAIRPSRTQLDTRHSSKFEEVVIGNPWTGETPKKKQKRERLYDDPAASLSYVENDVKQRRHDCLGIPVPLVSSKIQIDESVPEDSKCRQHCIICNEKTRWFCAGCHHHICVDGNPLQGGWNFYTMPTENGEKIVFRKTCFLLAHIDALKRNAMHEHVPMETPQHGASEITPHSRRH